jgi:hypothetical protein
MYSNMCSPIIHIIVRKGKTSCLLPSRSRKVYNIQKHAYQSLGLSTHKEESINKWVLMASCFEFQFPSIFYKRGTLFVSRSIQSDYVMTRHTQTQTKKPPHFQISIFPRMTMKSTNTHRYRYTHTQAPSGTSLNSQRPRCIMNVDSLQYNENQL